MRCFLGLALPDPVLDLLERLQDEIPVGRQVPWENLHITLSFLDEQPEARLEALHQELLRLKAAPLQLELRGLGVMGGQKPKSVERASHPQCGADRGASPSAHCGADLRYGIAAHPVSPPCDTGTVWGAPAAGTSSGDPSTAAAFWRLYHSGLYGAPDYALPIDTAARWRALRGAGAVPAGSRDSLRAQRNMPQQGYRGL